MASENLREVPEQGSERSEGLACGYLGEAPSRLKGQCARPEVEEVINLEMRGGVGEQLGFFQSPLLPGFQPAKAPVMLWDESSFPNTSASRNISMTVKVSVFHGQGLIIKGWGPAAGRTLCPGEPFVPV